MSLSKLRMHSGRASVLNASELDEAKVLRDRDVHATFQHRRGRFGQPSMRELHFGLTPPATQ